ncbi:MAG: T9SS type A sorting domain-containing protein [Ignavibacteriae bacterium]|nr:T9SS type A sorting domain-containing protein [Ignavibacteriota bacterium]
MKKSILLLIILILVCINFLQAKWINARDIRIYEDIYALKFINKDTGFAAGWSRYGSIMKTINGGESWEIKDSLPYQIFSINTLDGEMIYAAGSSLLNECGLLLHSTDGGKNWIPDYFDGKNRPFSYGFYNIELLNSETFLMCGYNGMIVKTSNSGFKWDTVHTGVNKEVFRILIFADENIGYAASGAGYDFENINKVYKTTDGGNNWFVIKERDSLLRIGTIKFVNPDVGYIFGKLDNKAIILKTTDSGLTWATNYIGRTDYLLTSADIVNENIILAAGEKNYVIKTTDGGLNWNEENSGGVNESYLSVECVDEFYGYLGASKGLIMKYDLFLNAEESNELSDITLYPNPIGEFAYFKLIEGNYGNYQLKIYDNTGAVIISQQGIAGRQIDVNLGTLETGIYFYSLLINNNKNLTGKFIKF